MNSWKHILSAVLISGFTFNIAAQDETQPLSPQLDAVTVDPYTGYAHLQWIPGGSPDVGRYVIYTYNNSIAYAIDTLKSPYATSYIHTGSMAKYMSVVYVVAAMDSSLNISPLSNSLSTVYLSATNDSCNHVIELAWSEYSNSFHPAERYEILVSEGGSPAISAGTIDLSVRRYGFSQYDPATEYCFFVNINGNTSTLASSNMVCRTSAREAAPSWTETVSVACMNKSIVVSGSYDPLSDINNFALEAYSGSADEWETLSFSTGSGSNVVFDNFVSDTTTVRLYRITAVNNCGNNVIPSLPVRNMVLTAHAAESAITLKWNNPFTSEEAEYTIWRNTGQSYREVTVLSDTIWADDYRLFASEVTTGRISYYITALRAGAPSATEVCRSSSADADAPENIFAANAFTPNDDGVNDTFSPLFSFIPRSYDFRIYNRHGVLLFSTNDYGTPWDGRHNGSPLPAGTYLWNCRMTTPSGKTVQRNGTVTILP